MHIMKDNQLDLIVAAQRYPIGTKRITFNAIAIPLLESPQRKSFHDQKGVIRVV